MYSADVTEVHEVLGAVCRVCQPSVEFVVVLLVAYVACVVLSHEVNGVEYTLVARHPSVESAVELLAAYCAAVTVVQLPLSDPLTRVRKPSVESTVVFVLS